MTTGAPIYLVSACASGEEFMVAFRRYADRNGIVFVPIADPLPPGKKARFALTLKDGGVMVEGDAEVVSSAKTPSVLYGRVGMTLKFTAPDEPSKTTLGELEKARLALKPLPPTIAPRPADVPAEPRPRPPVPTGRIDAVNALAECVAIGAGIPLPGEGGDAIPPKNPGQKFVVPSVPSIPPGRPRTPSVPPALPTAPKPGGATPPAFKALEPKPPTVAAPLAAAPLAKPTRDDPAPPSPMRIAVAASSARDKIDLSQTMRGPAPGVDLTASGKADLTTTMRGTKPAAGRNPPSPSTPPPVPRAPTPPAALPVTKPARMTTPFAPMPIVQQPAPPIVAVAKPAPEVEVSEATDLTAIPQVEDAVPGAGADSTVPVEIPHEGGSAPVMIVSEKPKEKTGRETRKTVMGVAVVPSGVMVLPAAPAKPLPTEIETRDTSEMASAADDVDALGATLPPQPPLPASVVHPTVEEPTPSGDWTMTPGLDGPTITPTPRDKAADKAAATPDDTKPVPPTRPTGDWMIALDPSQPDGWSEPSKIEKRPAGELPPGPPVSAVSSEKALDSNSRRAPDPEHAPEEKVQVDPTLIGPLVPMPPLDDDDEPALPPPGVSRPMVGDDGLMPVPTNLPPAAPPMYAAMPGPLPGSFVTPPAGHPHLASATGGLMPQPMVTDAGSGFFRESGEIQGYGTGPQAEINDAARKKRLIVIIASAGAVVVLGIVVLLALGGGGGKTKAAPDQPDSTGKPDKVVAPDKPDKPDEHVVISPPPDARSETPAAVDAAAAVAPAPDAAVVAIAPTDCKVSVSSVPGGAEVVIGKKVVGTTPAALTLPCGDEIKLVVRKTRFVSQSRSVTPKAEGSKLRVSLAKVTFSVKVSSTPPGASITVGSKPMGFTPTTVKLPAFEATTLKIVKDGFTADTQKITPKQNNQTVHATLKKLPKRSR